MIEGSEGVSVLHLNRHFEWFLSGPSNLPSFSVSGELHGLLKVLRLPNGRVGGTVGEVQSIYTELCVMDLLSKITSIRPVLPTSSLVLRSQPLIDHVPDPSTLDAGLIGIPEKVPVEVQVPVGVAHGVGELAKDDGPILVHPRSELKRVGHRSVHRTDDIREFGPSRALNEVSAALVHYGAGWVDGPQSLPCHRKSYAPPTLVSQGPDDNTRVVPVPLAHPGDATCERLRPCRVRHKFPHGLHAVNLDIGLVAEVHSVVVAKAVELGAVWVVARPDGVEVGLLEDCDVLDEAVDRDGLSGVRVVVVAVDSRDDDWFAVQRQNPLLGNLYGLESYPAPLSLEDVPLLVRCADHDGVTRRGLSRPECRLVHEALDLDGAPDAVYVVVLGLPPPDLWPLGVSALGVRHDVLVHLDVDTPRNGSRFHVDVDDDESRRVRLGADVYDVLSFPLPDNLYLPVDAAEPPVVLVLKVATVAPPYANDLDSDLPLLPLLPVVLPPQNSTEVELHGKAAILRVADERSVAEGVERRADAVEKHGNVLLPVCDLPGGGQSEGLPVNSGRVLLGHVRRGGGEGVLHICVYWDVAEVGT
mmetsp:Transcript_16730/g.34486  ORF Transcript_16730/g.34486 Transcript_16730/m.34486 type:complete len:586 (+) Transcript_16730:1460-3217(+)